MTLMFENLFWTFEIVFFYFQNRFQKLEVLGGWVWCSFPSFGWGCFPFSSVGWVLLDILVLFVQLFFSPHVGWCCLSSQPLGVAAVLPCALWAGAIFLGTSTTQKRERERERERKAARPKGEENFSLPSSSWYCLRLLWVVLPSSAFFGWRGRSLLRTK